MLSRFVERANIVGGQGFDLVELLRDGGFAKTNLQFLQLLLNDQVSGPGFLILAESLEGGTLDWHAESKK